MPGSTIVITPIPLARSSARLLIVPGLVILVGLLAAGLGVIVAGMAGSGLVAAGLVIVALAVYLVAVLFSVRLDVEVATLRLRWLGGERRYQLARGAVTRVPLHGPGAARLRARFGAIGWSVGPAMLRGSEPIEMVRLAPSSAVILVPTDRGRLAVAPRSERELLAALGAAARVQQRLDEVAAHTRELPAPAAQPSAATEPATATTAGLAPTVIAPVEGRMLTGIERAILEERLAEQRAAALAAAEAERARDAEARAAGAARAATAMTPSAPVPVARREPRAGEARPRWLRAPSLPRPALRGARAGLPAATLVSVGVAILPLLAAGGLWLAGSMTDRLPVGGAEARMAGLAVVLGGPAASLGGLIARAWFPRLLGVVVVTGLLALLLTGWALLR